MNIFELKPRVYFGEDSLSALAEIRAKSAVIFTDAFMEKSGNAQKIASLMSGCAAVRVYAKIIPDPPVELIADALSFLLEAETDAVVLRRMRNRCWNSAGRWGLPMKSI